MTRLVPVIPQETTMSQQANGDSIVRYGDSTRDSNPVVASIFSAPSATNDDKSLDDLLDEFSELNINKL